MAFVEAYIASSGGGSGGEEVTPEITGNRNCSCTVYGNGKQTWASSSGSATCYAELVNAVGDITITITGSGSSTTSSGDYSYGWSANATFNGITASKSGSGSFTINVGDTPVSGTLTINLSCSADVRSFRTDRYTWASCSLSTVTYTQGSGGSGHKVPIF